MSPENDTLRIERVQNGWVVFPHSFRGERDGYAPDRAFVARTPGELAQILLEWAGKQVAA